MIDLLFSLFRPETLFTILIAMAVFATVLTLAAPMMSNDALKQRMKLVASERDRMRASQKSQLGEARLREAKQGSLEQKIVDRLNLRRVFEAESSRDLLRQAGLRNESHLVTFLAARLIAPILLGAVVFIYSAVFFADMMTPLTRMAVTVGGAVLGVYLPIMILRNRVTRRQQSIRQAWPDALDLLLICVESGMAIEPALQRVAREIGPASVPLAEELSLTIAELSYLQDRRKAFENFAKRTGLPQVKAVVTSFIQSERYGTPLGVALRVLAQEYRDGRMSEAERKAAALAPRLTVPMIVFFLPVIFIVILGGPFIPLLGLR